MPQQRYVPRKEFNVYMISAFGQGMIYAMMSSYISDFYLNVLKVGPIFVLLLMLLARVWDAINDPLMGMIMDRTETKRGKMRPYILATPIPIAVLTVLLFFAPDISNAAKMVYASVTYVLWGMIYTMSDVPFWSMPNVMTPDAGERGKILSTARTANGIGSAIPMAIVMLIPALLTSMGLSGAKLEQTKYGVAAAFAAVIGNILFVLTYFYGKERIFVPRPQKKKKGEAGSLKLIFGCKPLMLVALTGIISAGRYMYQAGAIHVARYSFYIGKDLTTLATAAEREAAIQGSISKVQLIFSIATAVGMFGTMLLMPKLIEKHSYRSILISTCVVGAAASFVMYFIGYEHFWACIPFLVISAIPCGAINVSMSCMVGDCLDYMEWKTGRRENGFGSAIQSFVNKLGNALATTFIVLMYFIVKLDISTIGTKYTPDPTSFGDPIRSKMFWIVSLIPAISLLVCVIPLLFYNLQGKNKEQMLDELRKRRIDSGVLNEDGTAVAAPSGAAVEENAGSSSGDEGAK